MAADDDDLTDGDGDDDGDGHDDGDDDGHDDGGDGGDAPTESKSAKTAKPTGSAPRLPRQNPGRPLGSLFRDRDDD